MRGFWWDLDTLNTDCLETRQDLSPWLSASNTASKCPAMFWEGVRMKNDCVGLRPALRDFASNYLQPAASFGFELVETESPGCCLFSSTTAWSWGFPKNGSMLWPKSGMGSLNILSISSWLPDVRYVPGHSFGPRHICSSRLSTPKIQWSRTTTQQVVHPELFLRLIKTLQTFTPCEGGPYRWYLLGCLTPGGSKFVGTSFSKRNLGPLANNPCEKMLMRPGFWKTQSCIPWWKCQII